MGETTKNFMEASENLESLMTRELRANIDAGETGVSNLAAMIYIREYIKCFGKVVESLSKEIENLNEKIDKLSKRDMAQ